MDAAEALEVIYEVLPFVCRSEDAMQPGAPAVWDEVPDNILVDTHFGDKAGTDKAFAQAAHTVAMDFHIDRVTGVPMERVLRRQFRSGTGRYTLHAGGGGAVRQRRENCRRARHRSRDAARHELGCRRQFRHAQSGSMSNTR